MAGRQPDLAGAVTASGRLRLRRPRADDLDDVFRIHGDPRANVHNPAGPDPDRAASRRRLAEWMEHWAGYGFGYWVVESVPLAGQGLQPVIGFAGVRHGAWLERPVLNVYYRLAPEQWGRGFATELARHSVVTAQHDHPGRPVLARTTPGNVASQRTAAAAGLLRRPDLERDVGGVHAVILVSGWPPSRGTRAPGG